MWRVRHCYCEWVWRWRRTTLFQDKNSPLKLPNIVIHLPESLSQEKDTRFLLNLPSSWWWGRSLGCQYYYCSSRLWLVNYACVPNGLTRMVSLSFDVSLVTKRSLALEKLVMRRSMRKSMRRGMRRRENKWYLCSRRSSQIESHLVASMTQESFRDTNLACVNTE